MSSVKSIPTLEEAAKEIKQRDQKDRFGIGDIALEQFPIGEEGEHTGVLDGLRHLAELADYEFETLRRYRHIASRIPAERRRSVVSFSVYQEIADISKEETRTKWLDRLD